MLTAGEKWAGAANAPARSGLAFSSTICFPVSSFTYFYFQYSVLSFSSHCFPSQQDFNRLHYAALLMASLLIYALSLNWRLFCINGLMFPHKLPDKEKRNNNKIMCQGSGGKDIFKYRRIHQRRSNRLKVINITLIPLLGILETNSFHKDSDSEPIHCCTRQGKSAYTQVYKAYGRLRSSEASARSPASLCFCCCSSSLGMSSTLTLPLYFLLTFAPILSRLCLPFSPSVRTRLCREGCDCVSVRN